MDPRRVARRVLQLLARLVVAGVLLALAASACLVVVLYREGSRAPSGTPEYVNLGSSFAAGPGIGARAADSPRVCIRSANNFANQLARLRKLRLTDVSCFGATSRDLLLGGQVFQRAQVKAVTATTRLVTITVGADDLGLLDTLYAATCDSGAGEVPLAWRLTSCPDPPYSGTRAAQQDALDAATTRLARNLDAIVSLARSRAAPRARILLVDHTAVVPKVGSCPDRLPLTARQLESARTIQERLNETIREVASRQRVAVIRASELTAGHTVCASDPWVSLATFPRTRLSFAPVAFHPDLSAMTAIARAADARLTAADKADAARRKKA